MSTQNMISIAFTDPQLQAVDSAIGTVEQVFEPFIALSPGERKRLRRMGKGSEQFCRTALHTAELNPQILPGNVPLADALSDLKALDQLRPRLIRLLKLTQRASDTEAALGSDVLAVALKAYGAMKLSGGAEGLDTVLRDLSGRFARSTRKAEAPAA